MVSPFNMPSSCMMRLKSFVALLDAAACNAASASHAHSGSSKADMNIICFHATFLIIIASYLHRCAQVSIWLISKFDTLLCCKLQLVDDGLNLSSVCRLHKQL